VIIRSYLILVFATLFAACNAAADVLSLETVELGMNADQALKNYNHCETKTDFDELRLLSCDNKIGVNKYVNKVVYIDQSVDRVVLVKAEFGFKSLTEAENKYKELLQLYGEGVSRDLPGPNNRIWQSMCYGECSGDDPYFIDGSNLLVGIQSHGKRASVHVYLANHEAVRDLYRNVFHANNFAEEEHVEGSGNTYDLSQYKVAGISLGMHWDESARVVALRFDRNYYLVKFNMWRGRYIEHNSISGLKQSRAIRVKTSDRSERVTIYFADNLPPHSKRETQVAFFILHSTTDENMAMLVKEAFDSLGQPTRTTPNFFSWCESADEKSLNGCGPGAYLRFERKSSRITIATDSYGKKLREYLAEREK